MKVTISKFKFSASTETCLALLLFVGIFLLTSPSLAWDEPTSDPPGGNRPAPINIGSSAVDTQIIQVGSLKIGQSSATMTAPRYCFLDNTCVSSWAGIGGAGHWTTTTAGTGIFYNAGNVGIGTTTPSQKLDVAGGALRLVPQTGYGVYNLNGSMYYDSATNKFKCYENGAWVNCVGDTTSGLSGSGTANFLSKFTNTNTLGNSNIYQDASGNVSVNTTVTGPKFRVESGESSISTFWGTGGINQWVTVGRNSGNFMNLGVGATTPAPYIWSSNGNFFVGSDGFPTLYVSGMNNGNVGVGVVPASTYKLDVGGWIHAASSPNALVKIDGDANGNPYLEFAQANNAKAQIQYVDNAANPTNDTVQIRNGGNPGVLGIAVNTQGKVGIATTTFPSTLDLLINNRVGAREYCDQNGQNCKTIASMGGSSGLWSTSTVNANDIYNTTLAGKVGIGINNPSQKLTVVDTVDAAQVAMSVTNNSASTDDNTRAQICAVLSGGRGSSCLVKRDGYNGDANPTLLWSDTGPFLFVGSSGSKLMTVTQAGNVGVGTSTPNSIMHLYSTAVNPEIDLQGVSGANNHWAMYINRSNNYFNIWGSGASGNNRLTIAPDGSVGINTSIPGAQMDISGVTHIRSDKSYYDLNGDNAVNSTDVNIVTSCVLETPPYSSSNPICKRAASLMPSFDSTDALDVQVEVNASMGYFGAVALSVSGGITASGDICTYQNNNVKCLSGLDSYWARNGATTFNNNLANVAIGTSTATQKLEVNGAIRLTPQTSFTESATGTGSMYYSSASGKFRCNEGGTWKDCIGVGGGSGGNFWATSTGSANSIYSTVSGNVGIGSSTPYYKLAVVGNASFGNPAGNAEIKIDGNGGKIRILASGTTGNYIQSGSDWSSGAATTLNFGPMLSGTPWMTLLNTGNVGVAKTDPAEKLDVAGRIRSTNTSGNPEIQLQYGAGDNHWGIYSDQSNSDALNIWAYNSGTSGNRMTILQNGYVGIGTSTPGAWLNVKDQLLVRNGSYIEVKPGGSDYGLVIRDVDSSYYANIDANDGYLSLGYNASAGPLYVSNSNVGIGVAPTAEKLTVNGNIIALGAVTSTRLALGGYGVSSTHNLTTPSIYSLIAEVGRLKTSGLADMGAGSINAEKLCINGDCKTSWPAQLANFTCPDGKFVKGFDASGNPVCAVATGYTGSGIHTYSASYGSFVGGCPRTYNAPDPDMSCSTSDTMVSPMTCTGTIWAGRYFTCPAGYNVVEMSQTPTYDQVGIYHMEIGTGTCVQTYLLTSIRVKYGCQAAD